MPCDFKCRIFYMIIRQSRRCYSYPLIAAISPCLYRKRVRYVDTHFPNYYCEMIQYTVISNIDKIVHFLRYPCIYGIWMDLEVINCIINWQPFLKSKIYFMKGSKSYDLNKIDGSKFARLCSFQNIEFLNLGK